MDTAVAVQVRAPDESAVTRMRLAARPLVAQWGRFLIVGVANTLLSFGLYALQVHIGTQYLLASAVACTVATANSYVLNRRWTFRSSMRRVPEACRFCVTQGCGLALNLCLLYLLVHDMHVPRLLSQATAIPMVSVATFIANRRWTFAGP